MNIQRTIPSPPGNEDGYDTDFLRWTEQQVDALRARELTRIDWDNLVEEVETLGRSERNELFNRLRTIIEHLLKYEYGLDRNPAAGWKRTIIGQRPKLLDHINQSPSLRPIASTMLQDLYEDARRQALAAFEEYEPFRLSEYEAALPATVPYTLDQILDKDWLPTPTDAR